MADIYLTRTTEYVKTHPDFEETLQAASKQGLDMSSAAVAAIRQNGWPEVAHYLAQNFSHAHRVMSLSPDEQVKEVSRLQERLVSHGTMQELPADEYIRRERRKIRNGERGRF